MLTERAIPVSDVKNTWTKRGVPVELNRISIERGGGYGMGRAELAAHREAIHIEDAACRCIDRDRIDFH